MLRQIALLSLATLLTATVNVATSQDTDEQIQRVETSLAGSIKLEGEPAWTIQERMEHYGVLGLCIAVVQDHKVIWTKGYGVKDRETGQPVTSDTLFQCASISKPVAAAAALRLVEQGVFDLESNINEFLTNWKLPENEFTAKQHVTLKHLVSHTGGLTVHGFLGYGDGLEVPSLIDVLNGSGPANSPPIRVDKAPGGDFRYSGGGYCIMQQMMIDAIQKPFPEIMDQLVLNPLDMRKSTFAHPLPEALHSVAATGYLRDGEAVSGKRHTYPEMAPAGLYSTASELAGFFIEMQRAYQGKSHRIFSKEMAQRMMNESDALGIGIGNHNGETYIGHGGWNEGFSSDANFHRDRDYGVVILTNGNQPPLIEEIENAVARVYGWHNCVTPEYKPLELGDVQPLVGRYDHSGSLLRITKRNGKLWLSSNLSDPIEMVRVGKNQFVCRSIEDVIYFDELDKEHMQLSFKKPWEDTADESNIAPRLSDNQRLPIEWLDSGDFKKSLAGYRQLLENDPDSAAVNEDRINALGYQLMGYEQLEKAIDIFRINTLLYPEAFNTFDSLGEAYMNDGNAELAILNYEKSLELNPQNENAKTMIERINRLSGQTN